MHGSTLNREADDVVQMFLANSGGGGAAAMTASGLAAAAPGASGGANPSGQRQQLPGKIEDLPSPTGDFGQQQVSFFKQIRT